ncbi:MAG: hypothetical protein WDN69_00710 [Aliidongia sp.]
MRAAGGPDHPERHESDADQHRQIDGQMLGRFAPGQTVPDMDEGMEAKEPGGRRSGRPCGRVAKGPEQPECGNQERRPGVASEMRVERTGLGDAGYQIVKGVRDEQQCRAGRELDQAESESNDPMHHGNSVFIWIQDEAAEAPVTGVDRNLSGRRSARNARQ